MRNIQKIIKNIVAKEPTPDENYTPKIILRWSTKTEGQIYHDLSTGKRLTHDERDTFLKWENFSYNYLSYSTGASPRITYIKYHRRQNVMELAYVNITKIGLVIQRGILLICHNILADCFGAMVRLHQ